MFLGTVLYNKVIVSQTNKAQETKKQPGNKRVLQNGT